MELTITEDTNANVRIQCMVCGYLPTVHEVQKQEINFEYFSFCHSSIQRKVKFEQKTQTFHIPGNSLCLRKCTPRWILYKELLIYTTLTQSSDKFEIQIWKLTDAEICDILWMKNKTKNTWKFLPFAATGSCKER